jgi:hypothetical protein
MPTLSGTIRCPRCGFLNPAGVASCGACGMVRSSKTVHSPLAASPAATPSSPGSGSHHAPSLRGAVIAVDPVYMTKPEFHWGRFLWTTCIRLLLLPFAVVLFLPFFIINLFVRSRPPGFMSHLSSEVLSFWLITKFFRKDEVPVRDIRLRDLSASERLVRIRGHFVAGNVNVGDDITVEGVDRQGTLMFRRGFNHRTNSAIRVHLQ